MEHVEQRALRPIVSMLSTHCEYYGEILARLQALSLAADDPAWFV